MATMITKKTGSTLTSWEYYIENKKDWERFKDILKVEDGPAGLVNEKGEIILIVDNKTPIILLDNKTKKIDKLGKGKSILHGHVSCKGKKGYMSIKYIGKPNNTTTLKEDMALSDLDKQIKKRANGKGITIIIKNNNNKIEYIFENCTGARTIKGTPKADFCILSENKEICYISHKDGKGAAAFQQYVSITGKGNDGINNHSEVIDTIKKFVINYDFITQGRKRFKKTLSVNKHKDLINKSIYGPDFGKAFSKDHVHFIAQGNPILKEYDIKEPILKKYGSVYELTFSSSLSCSGELKEFSQSGYIPIILARFQTGRKFYSDNKEYTDVRLLIAPEALSSTAMEI